MPPEYNPAATDDVTAIAPPAVAPAAPAPVSTGEGYDKALNSERASRKALEKEMATLKGLVQEKERQLEQTNMTLEQKYQADLEASKQSYQSQVDAAISERDARLQQEAEARMTAEQRLQAIEVQDAARTITNTFANKIGALLVDPSEDIDYFLTKYGDNFALTNDGQVVARDSQGNLSVIEDLIGFFQEKHPRMFKAPEQQNTGGGYRNLANTTGNVPRQGQSQPLKVSIADINANPKLFLENRDRIEKGDFSTT